MSVTASSTPDAARTFWHGVARRLSWRVNVAAWWERFIAPAMAASVLFAGALLTSRRHGVPTPWLWSGFAAALAAGAAYAAWRTRRGRFTPAAALVELDVALGLKTRLTAAAAGVGDWPRVPAEAPRVLRWRASRVLVPPAFAAALLAVAGFIPISRTDAPPRPPTDTPAAWRQMDEWLKGLAQQDLARPDSVEAWEERVNKLRRQPDSTWYSHGSLEAGDTLHQQLEVGLRSLGNDLDEAAEALDNLDSVGGSSHEAGAPSEDSLDRAMERLESGAVPLNPKLLSQLKAAKGKSGKPLSMAELEKLRHRLREGAGFCRLSIRECELGHKECKNGSCRRGRGAVARGPGEAPLSLEHDASRTASERLEGVSNEDMQNASLGDTIGMSRTTHKVERGGAASAAGGAVNARPSGGETVWRDALTPEEQQVLQRYFK